MPQVKKTQELYGVKYALFNAVGKYLAEDCRGREFILDSEEISTLICVATHPTVLRIKGLKTREDFGLLYGRIPDEVLSMLQLIRQTLTKQAKTQYGVVKQFLLQHSTIEFKGKRVAVHDMTDGEIAEYLTKPELDITPASVATERKALGRYLRPLAIFQNPEAQHFMRTGKMTPKLKRLLLSRQRKGKK